MIKWTPFTLWMIVSQRSLQGWKRYQGSVATSSNACVTSEGGMWLQLAAMEWPTKPTTNRTDIALGQSVYSGRQCNSCTVGHYHSKLYNVQATDHGLCPKVGSFIWNGGTSRVRRCNRNECHSASNDRSRRSTHTADTRTSASNSTTTTPGSAGPIEVEMTWLRDESRNCGRGLLGPLFKSWKGFDQFWLTKGLEGNGWQQQLVGGTSSCKSCGKVAAEGKGSWGGRKVQKQPRGRTVEQELVVQVIEKDIKGEEQERSGVRFNKDEERSSRVVKGGERIPSCGIWREGCTSLEYLVLESESNLWNWVEYFM